jgi:1,4-alpha-glucan branching enzyme
MRTKIHSSATAGEPQLSVPGCYDSYEFMGAHPSQQFGEQGWMFRVWAPNARAVAVVGDFNGWDQQKHPMIRSHGGIWYLFIPGLQQYDNYQYAVCTPSGEWLFKADPYAFHAATRPDTASKLYNLEGYQWGDSHWTDYRRRTVGRDRPLNTYEVHLGSWRRNAEGQVISYRTIASYLVPYVKEMGYTGVLLMPVGEHPDDESLGYQESGCFAVTSRFGTPTDFMYLVDQLHQAGISVVMDCTSLNFSTAVFGLSRFDGTPCYGTPAPGNPDEELEQFDFSRPQVENFAVSYVFFWMRMFHLDGFFYTRVEGMDAALVRRIVASVRAAFPYRWESIGTADLLGDTGRFWNADWTRAILNRITDPQRTDPILSCAPPPSPLCTLPISHDIVSHPYPSLVARMRGDADQKFAGARAFYLFLLCQPGQKLTMMGTEFGQWNSWNCMQSLDWHLLDTGFYRNHQRFFRQANEFYLTTSALWKRRSAESMCTLRDEGQDQMVVQSLREGRREFLTVANFSQAEQHLSLEVEKSAYEVIFSTDEWEYGGQGRGSAGVVLVRGGLLELSVPPVTTFVLRSTKKKL